LKDLVWSGALQTLVLLLALWLVWLHTSGFTDRLDSQQPQIQLLVLATMLGTLMMAAAVPEAFGEQGLLFAGSYVVTEVGRHAAAVLLLRGHEAATAFARNLFWSVVSVVPWIAGALAHDTAREVLWVLAGRCAMPNSAKPEWQTGHRGRIAARTAPRSRWSARSCI
jgi:low temperature requirement protein LtrA